MAMAVKLELEAFDSLSSPKESPNAKKSGSCSYWDSDICDGGRSRRIYGYDGGVRRKLFEHQESGDTIDLVNCVVVMISRFW